MTEPVLQIVIGCIFLPFLIGIFLIVKGIKEAKDFSLNNAAEEYCLRLDEQTNQYIAILIDGRAYSVPEENEKSLYYSPKSGRLYLTIKNERLDLGFCYYSEYRNFVATNAF